MALHVLSYETQLQPKLDDPTLMIQPLQGLGQQSNTDDIRQEGVALDISWIVCSDN